MPEEQEDDDIVIDFSKIKQVFSRKEKKDHEKAQKNNSHHKKKSEEAPNEDKHKEQSSPEAKKPSKDPKHESEIKHKEDKKTESEVHKEKKSHTATKTEKAPNEKEVKVEKKEEKQEEVSNSEEKQEEDDEETDDEISIDFSKIKNFFSSKEKKPVKEKNHTKQVEESETKTSEETEDDETEITIDFSKIKSFFKSDNKKEMHKEQSSLTPKKSEESEDDIKIDWKKTGDFAKKHAVILLILIPIFLSIFFRIQPAELPITDQWATDTVINHFRGQVAEQVNAQYPNLPQANKNKLIEAQLSDFLTTQSDGVDQQITQVSNQFKDQLRDESGQTYLLAIDPYFWERHARNVVEKGHPGDIIKNGVPWNDHMFAPKGRQIPADMLHAYVEAYIYKFFRFFNNDLPLKNVAFFIPVFLATLAVIPTFFIGKRLGGNIAGLFGAILIAVHGQFMTRTSAGFADTDAYTVTLPLFIVWTFLEAFEARELWKKVTLISISSFLVGLFSFSWTGAWYIFDIILASLGIYLIYIFAKNFKKERFNVFSLLKQPAIKNTILLIVLFFVLSGIFVSVFRDTTTFTGSFIKGPLGFSELKDVATKTVWPNVYTTVAEQNPSSLPGVINAMGGKMLFFLAIIGALLSVLKKDKDENRDIKLAAMLLIWMAVSTYAAVRGVRFSLLIVPPFAIGFGMFVGILYEYLATWTSKELKISKIMTGLVLLLLFGTLLISPIQAGWKIASNEVPSMNDGWYRALDKINKEAEPDAIINSWWDFGHWFKNIGDRAVTFDGTSQNTPQAHWIGKVLLTDDETEAIGILRMLDCGANHAYELVEEKLDDPYASILIIKKIILLNKSKAKDVLENAGFNDNEANTVLENTHCDPPEDYFIVSEDMIGKSGVWAHFGSWNFSRSAMYKSVNNMAPAEGISYLEEEFGLDEQIAQSTYYDIQTADPNQWIAPWPSYASGLSGCTEEGDLLKCTNNIIIDRTNPDKFEAYVDSPQGKIYPQVFSYPTTEGIKTVTHYEGELFRTQDGRALGLTLIPQGNSYKILLLSPELSASMFTRMFHMDAHGLKHFKLFTTEQTISGGRVYVYKVSWDGEEMNLMPALAPKTEVKDGYTVSMNYVGYTEDKIVFDSSIQVADKTSLSADADFDDYNVTPFSFQAGSGQIIAGLDTRMKGMKIGEEKVLEIPPAEAYGIDPTTHPLGNKTLFFKVRIESLS